MVIMIQFKILMLLDLYTFFKNALSFNEVNTVHSESAVIAISINKSNEDSRSREATATLSVSHHRHYFLLAK